MKNVHVTSRALPFESANQRLLWRSDPRRLAHVSERSACLILKGLSRGARTVVPLSSLLGRDRVVMEPKHMNDEQQLFAGFKTAFKSFATEAIHVGQEPEQWSSMAVVPPISLSTTFKQLEPGNHMVK